MSAWVLRYGRGWSEYACALCGAKPPPSRDLPCACLAPRKRGAPRFDEKLSRALARAWQDGSTPDAPEQPNDPTWVEPDNAPHVLAAYECGRTYRRLHDEAWDKTGPYAGQFLRNPYALNVVWRIGGVPLEYAARSAGDLRDVTNALTSLCSLSSAPTSMAQQSLAMVTTQYVPQGPQ